MVITASQVKELRKRTGVGIMDAKKALVEVDGDMDKAIDLLRRKGMSKAAKKIDRITAEGLTGIYTDGNTAALVEINSETDFVAKNEQFKLIVADIAKIVAKNRPQNLTQAMALTNDKGVTIDAELIQGTQIIGEKLSFRRFKTIEKSNLENFGVYSHMGGRIGVITVVEGGNEKLAKDLAMHIAAMRPQVLSYKDLNPKFIEQEMVALVARLEIENKDRKRTGKSALRIPTYGSQLQLTDKVLAKTKAKLESDLAKQGKLEKIWNRIIPGQMDKFVKENTEIDQQYTLLSQSYVLDDSKTVAKFLKSKGALIKSFFRFEVGEGIDKKEDNFAEEVMSQVKLNK
ncbi:MAG: translation elongation factor Ts [Streptococcaceae bacterium]|jgi:elongation factor Ts|nr:translation elongation factor Ts [Streptococcaceae bacterium]